MTAASPAAALEPVNAHRFYLYQLCGLDMTQDADKPKIREFLFERGYGNDPKAYISKRNRAKLQHTDTPSTPTETPEENSKNREAATDRFCPWIHPKNAFKSNLSRTTQAQGKHTHLSKRRNSMESQYLHSPSITNSHNNLLKSLWSLDSRTHFIYWGGSTTGTHQASQIYPSQTAPSTFLT